MRGDDDGGRKDDVCSVHIHALTGSEHWVVGGHIQGRNIAGGTCHAAATPVDSTLRSPERVKAHVDGWVPALATAESCKGWA